MADSDIRLVIVTGLSGSGKSVALDMLEDLDFYCIDNLPSGLVEPFLVQAAEGRLQAYRRTAIALDARNLPEDLVRVPEMIGKLRATGLQVDVIFLDADDDVVIKRYAESRRRHPLSRKGLSLSGAIEFEREVLRPLHQIADLMIDSSRTNVHQLRRIIGQRVAEHEAGTLALNFTSFGFKHGLPHDADYVFDARFLPNPYWEHELRDLNGLNPAIIQYLESHQAVNDFVKALINFLEPCLRAQSLQNRSFLTIAVGCTGGLHRSVYLCEKLAGHFLASYPQVSVRHTELMDQDRIPTLVT
ncbi:MAG: RNase adapter RapZ [Gammaproteobacteria bacterium]|nr:RNase adapter RapZ [Gammaproteobacteria bacterium]